MRVAAEDHLIRWMKPGRDMLKINTSGSSLDNPGRAGFGGDIRDGHGA
ncbi:ribonuclease h protein [Senna tora]|uniref:Ribonuclease h protein n=1 Tax=Senna tora TaxID=362788 RepID=A0A834W733_9FABA|nr:ribonuclease h protein [Senna tora]